MTTHIPISKIHKSLKTEDFALVIAKRKYLTIMSVRCVCSIHYYKHIRRNACATSRQRSVRNLCLWENGFRKTTNKKLCVEF